jgi:hypothetical protein
MPARCNSMGRGEHSYMLLAPAHTHTAAKWPVVLSPSPHPLAALRCYRAKLRVRKSRVTRASAWLAHMTLAQWRVALECGLAGRSHVELRVCILAYVVLCMLKYNMKLSSEMTGMCFIFVPSSNLTKTKHLAPFWIWVISLLGSSVPCYDFYLFIFNYFFTFDTSKVYF